MSNEALVQHRSLSEIVSFLNEEQKLKDRFPCRFVFVSSFVQYKDLVLALRQKAGVVMRLSDDSFCHGADVLPRFDDVIKSVANTKPTAILLEAFGEYLRLTEKNPSFSQKVKSLLELECHSTKRVWIPVLCAKTIFFSIVGQLNHRYENAMYEIDLPSNDNSVFVLNVYPPSIQSIEDETTIQGIKNWLKQWEELTITSGNTLVTRQTALFTPTTGNYTVRVISDPFMFLQERLNDAGTLNKEMGTSEQWGWLAGKVSSTTTTVELLIKKVLNVQSFEPLSILSRWNEESACSTNIKWLFWLWYHKGANVGGDYFSYAISQAEVPDRIPEKIELAILDDGIKNNIDFARVQRKKALIYLKTEKRSNAFWEKWKSISDDYLRLKLLTDDTREERVETIKLVGEMLKKKQMLSDICYVIQTTYPDLAYYLCESAFMKDSEWKQYIAEYKQQKVMDIFDPGIDRMISKPQLLSVPSRHQLLSDCRNDQDYTLIVDGLGIEWIDLLVSCIQGKRQDIKFQFSIGSAKVPTITSANHFWDDWNEDTYRKNDRLDSKSHIKDKSDGIDPYALTELQFSIIKDLAKEIIDLVDSKGKLIVTADHGLSRLAAIHFRQRPPVYPPSGSDVCQMGRYCEVPASYNNTNDKCYKYDQYLLMVTHDHFSCSGYLPGETHGGMTPEEYLVPVFAFFIDNVIPKTAKKSPIQYSILETSIKLNEKNQAVFLIKAPGARVMKAQANNEIVTGVKIAEDTWSIAFSSLRSGSTYELKVFPNNIASGKKEQISILTRGMIVEDDF